MAGFDGLDENIKIYAARGLWTTRTEGGGAFDDDEEEEEVVVAMTSDDDDTMRALEEEVDDLLGPMPKKR